MTENDKKEKSKDFVGLVFVGCLFLGLAAGFLMNNVAVGLFIGLGVGFILMGLLRIIFPNK